MSPVLSVPSASGAFAAVVASSKRVCVVSTSCSKVAALASRIATCDSLAVAASSRAAASVSRVNALLAAVLAAIAKVSNVVTNPALTPGMLIIAATGSTSIFETLDGPGADPMLSTAASINVWFVCAELRSTETRYEANCDKRRRDRLRRAKTDASQCPSTEETSIAVYAAVQASSSESASIVDWTSNTLAPAIAESARRVALATYVPFKAATSMSRDALAPDFAVSASSAAEKEAAAAVSAFDLAVAASTLAASASARAASAAAVFASSSTWRYATASDDPSGGMGGDGSGGGDAGKGGGGGDGETGGGGAGFGGSGFGGGLSSSGGGGLGFNGGGDGGGGGGIEATNPKIRACPAPLLFFIEPTATRSPS